MYAERLEKSEEKPFGPEEEPYLEERRESNVRQMSNAAEAYVVKEADADRENVGYVVKKVDADGENVGYVVKEVDADREHVVYVVKQVDADGENVGYVVKEVDDEEQQSKPSVLVTRHVTVLGQHNHNTDQWTTTNHARVIKL